MSQDGSAAHTTSESSILPASIREAAQVVLVVDADDAERRLLLRTLRPVYTVYALAEPAEAVQVLATVQNVACVVASMPSGASLARKMRSDKRLRNVPVFLVASKGSADDVVAGINVGARHVFLGPVRLKELLEKVAGAIASG
jgi:PleD family two-component response regulator